MFHPVGPQPPSVYWRRRLALLASVVVLVVLLVITLKVVASDGSTPPRANGTPTTVAPTSGTTSLPPTTPSSTTATLSTSAAADTSRTPTAPPRCDPKQLAVAAVTGRTAYQVGQQPLLEVQVTNTSTAPCVQDLADTQVELKVYNGESRVWGSHDCKTEPGVTDRTLAPATPVRVAITWSGLSSRPGCAGTRQRVGAGTYTLYAKLSGRTGKAAQFTIG